MFIPNVHVGPPVRSWSALWLMVAAYRLPLLIFFLASALACGYNVFFLRLLRAVREVEEYNSLTAETLRDPQASQYIRRHTTTGTYVVCALTVGNTLCGLVYWSLARVIFTCAGYVPADPWRCTPHFDAKRRHHLQVTWFAQQQCIREQGVAARQRAEQALREQQNWWAYQTHMLQDQPPSTYHTPAPWLVTPLGAPLPSAGARGRLPASGGASSIASFLGNVPPLPQPFSSEPSAVGCHENAPTAAVAAAAVSYSADPKNIAANPSKAEIFRPECAAAEKTCLAFSKANRSSSFPSAAAKAVATRTAASTSASSSSSSPSFSSASEASTASALDQGSTGANGVRSSDHVPPATVSPYPRSCPSAASVESTANSNVVLEYEADGSLRFCGVCHQFKPDGSRHCRACQRCVFDMDHHCHFLNNCIGRDNYKHFFLCGFYSTVCTAVNATLFTMAYLRSAVCHDWGLGWWCLPAGMCAVGVCVAYLWVQHIFLLIRGVGTLDRMAEVSAERFLVSVSGSQHGRVVTTGGCRHDCRMAVDESVRGIVALMKRFVGSVGRHRGFCRIRQATTSSLTTDGRGGDQAGASPTLYSRADRRAQRIALLFGRPRFCLYHLLPLAPPSERLQPLLRSCEGEV